MHDNRELVEGRLRRELRERVVPAIYGSQTPLAVSAFHVPGEPVPWSVADAATYEPFAVGARWGAPWSTTWFRMEGTVPAEWEGETVEAIVDLGFSGMPGFQCEGMLWRDGKVVRGIAPEHRTIAVTDKAEGGEAVSLHLEAAANPTVILSFQPTPLGDRATAGDSPQYRLNQAALAVVRPDVRAFVFDVRVLRGLMNELPVNEPRRNLILRALERAFDQLDLHDVEATAAAARAELAGVLAQPAHASAHRITAIGHAHIDSAWLWPLRETRRKCARTFSTAVALMDDYPEYKFACSQAQQYAWIEEEHPELFARIAGKVDAGQWLPVGSMWVEADCNLPSGESLVRQFVHGKRYFLDRFGVETTEVWLPDVFGYAGNLPQLLALAGCRRFLTQKLSWNQTNKFPHHTFWWEGIDGTRVFTHFPPVDTYNGVMSARELLHAVHNFADHGHANSSLYPFGHGDGGGGPTAEMLELARRFADLEGAPRVTIGSPDEFFTAAEAEYADAPVWRGELYFETHRGTYTTQAKTKQGNRRAEVLLREAELWSALAGVWPADDLDRLWKVVLLHQFHDIIPGSSIAWVHDDTEAAHAAVHVEAIALRDAALAQLGAAGDGLIVANAATHARREVVDSPDGPVAVDVGGLTMAPLRPVDLAPVEVGDHWFDNGILRVEWDDLGLLTSVRLVADGRDAIAPGGHGNRLQIHPDHPVNYDAWDLDAHYLNRVDDLTEADSVTIVERGPLVATVEVVRTFGASRIAQRYELRAGARRLDIHTVLDWHEDEKVLKAAFPLGVRADDVACDVQFGYVRRPVHRNTSWDVARFEVCAHRWVDVSDAGWGVALLNDGKYGHDVSENVMRLTLARAPRYPDPEADRGRHTFTYALMPHAGRGPTAAVVNEAAALNIPLVVTAGAVTAPRSLVAVEPTSVLVEAVKRADDGSGDLVVRLYEALGAATTAQVRVPGGFASAGVVDLLERPRADATVVENAVSLELRPFEVVTLRFSPR